MAIFVTPLDFKYSTVLVVISSNWGLRQTLPIQAPRSSFASLSQQKNVNYCMDPTLACKGKERTFFLRTKRHHDNNLA